MTFHFYCDPGHGWLKVPKAQLTKLAIAHKISRCSYQTEKYAYLEEDCDANLFLQTLEKTGQPYTITEHNSNSDSHIRRYPSYEATEATPCEP